MIHAHVEVGKNIKIVVEETLKINRVDIKKCKHSLNFICKKYLQANRVYLIDMLYFYKSFLVFTKYLIGYIIIKVMINGRRSKMCLARLLTRI